MRLKIVMLLLFATASCFEIGRAGAQDDVELARIYPPGTSSQNKNLALPNEALALKSIAWQLELKQELMNRYESRKDQLLRLKEENRHMIRALTGELPTEVRFIDDAVRSRLIGKAMEELLGARLDLATRETSMKQLQEMLVAKKDDKKSKWLKKQSQMAIEAARLKLDLAQSEYESSKNLVKKGYVTEKEEKVSQYNLALARQELESVMLRADVESEHQNAEVAQRLTDVRIDVEPIKARIVEVEKFLKTFVESSEISAKIAEIQSEIDNRQQDVRVLAVESFRLSQEIEELSVLKSRIEAKFDELGAAQRAAQKAKEEQKDKKKDE